MNGKVTILLMLIYLVISYGNSVCQAPDTLWTRTYGSQDRIDDCWDAIGTVDGGLLLIGTSTYQSATDNLRMIRIDSDGEVVWDSLYVDGTFGYAVCAAPDGGFMIAGVVVQNQQIPFVMKIDSTGNEIWFETYPHWGSAVLRSIEPVGNDGYILAGFETIAQNGDDVLVVRIDSDGDTLWSRIYGGQQHDKGWSARPTMDGGFIVGAWTESFGNGGSDFYLLKTDAYGDTMWTRVYGDQWNEEIRDIMETGVGTYVFSGKRSISQESPLYCIMAVNSDGDSVWAFSHNPNSTHAILHSFTPTLNGGYASIGYTWESIDIFKIDSSGNLLWSITFYDDPVINLKGRVIIQAPDGSYFLCGNNADDIWVVKLAPEVTGIEREASSIPERISLYQNYPNPFNGSTRISFSLGFPSSDIKLSIYDITGRMFREYSWNALHAGTHYVLWDGTNADGKPVASGVYFYRIDVAEVTVAIKRALLIK